MDRVRAFASDWYLSALFVVWTFAPEARRLTDWQFGYHEFSPFSVLPLLALVPGVAMIPIMWSTLGRTYRVVLVLWYVGFAFSFLVAFASGQLFGAVFALAEFALPAGVASLFLISRRPFREMYDRIAATLLICAAISGSYAVFQYVAPPPWDVYWIQNTHIDSMGAPVPFSLRVFGTFNSDGPFALLLLAAIIMNFPRLKAAAWRRSVLLAPCLVALLLTQVRLAWIGLLAGIAIYLLLTPRRGGVILSFASIALLFALVTSGLVMTVPSADLAVESVSTRLNTFGQLQTDSSVTARQSESSDAFGESLREPLGQGLGSSGLASKLSGTAGGGLDNGYLSRFGEMGFFGWTTYLLALVVAFFSTVSAYVYARRKNAMTAASISAMAVAMQAVLLFLEAGFDNHGGYVGIFFWLSLMVGESTRTLAEDERVAASMMRNFDRREVFAT